jgi:hypothetical protein
MAKARKVQEQKAPEQEAPAQAPEQAPEAAPAKKKAKKFRIVQHFVNMESPHGGKPTAHNWMAGDEYTGSKHEEALAAGVIEAEG